MTRVACSSRNGSPRTTFTSPTTPSCRSLSTAGGGSKATSPTSPACHRTYATYVNGAYTTTYLAHTTALTGSRSMQTITPAEQPFRHRLHSFKKNNWETFTTTIDNGITSLASSSWKAYKSFSVLVRVCVHKCIPRGCRTRYISGLTPESGELLKHYQELCDADPFSENTIESGTNLNDIKETRKQKLEETHSSKNGWQTLSKINGDNRKPISSPNITPDAIAHQLLLNGKPDQNCKICNKNAVLQTDRHETILTPFTIRDLGDAISLLKNSKAPGLDNIHHEWSNASDQPHGFGSWIICSMTALNNSRFQTNGGKQK